MSNIFSLFGSKILSQSSSRSDGKIPYKAFTCLDPNSDRYRGELGIVLHYENGVEEVMYYSYLMRAMIDPPNTLALMCTDCVYTISGKNLLPLMPLLRDHHIRSLEAFNPEKHIPLAMDSDEMVIDSILIQNNAAWWEAIDQRRATRKQET